MIEYFHQVDDPYSHLAVQTLARLVTLYGVEVRAHLVAAPDAGAAPELDKLAALARRDAAAIAPAYGLSFPAQALAPEADLVALAQAALASSLGQGRFIELAPGISQALWSGDRARLQANVLAGPDQSANTLALGTARREALGHYLGAMFYFEGEFYWGIDRLGHLETRLAPTRAAQIAPAREPVLGAVPNFSTPPVIDFWFSIRSPYSWIVFPRMVNLARHYGAELDLRYVLPMVMRGLPVPRAKSRYIVLDTKREAERLGLPFGTIVDPVGLGTENALSILHRLHGSERAVTFAHAALEGAWARGVDLANDRDLRDLARAAGVSGEEVTAALADPSWRTRVEGHRHDLFEAGLWGVPSFRVRGRAPHWGQDRLWLLEQDILAEGPNIKHRGQRQ